MSDPIDHVPGEISLKETDAVYPRNRWLGLGYRPTLGKLTLTNRRLIFKAAESQDGLAFPLAHIAGAEASGRTIRTAKIEADPLGSFTATSTLMLITFDDGGREYFAVKDLAGWTDSILAARKSAPPLDYTTIPNRRPGVETSFKQVVLWLAGLSALVCSASVCCSLALTFIPALLPFVALLGGGGK